MNLPLNVEVRGTDGVLGRSAIIILNPLTRRATHLVVQEKGLIGTQRLVPFDLIGDCTPTLIRLRISSAAFGKLEPFIEAQFASMADYYVAWNDHMAWYTGTDDYLLWPYVYAKEPFVVSSVERLPAGELAVHRGTEVHANDGKVGQVDEFLVNRGTGQITHLILREGHFWRKTHVTIPISQIERIETNALFLKLSKQAISTLPHIPIVRPKLIVK